MSFETGCGIREGCRAVEHLTVHGKLHAKKAAEEVVERNGAEPLKQLFNEDEQAVFWLAEEESTHPTDADTDATFVIIRRLVTGECPCYKNC